MRKTTKITITLSGASVDIRNKNLVIKSPDCYRYTSKQSRSFYQKHGSKAWAKYEISYIYQHILLLSHICLEVAPCPKVIKIKSLVQTAVKFRGRHGHLT